MKIRPNILRLVMLLGVATVLDAAKIEASSSQDFIAIVKELKKSYKKGKDFNSLEKLLRRGGYVNATDEEGNTPLHRVAGAITRGELRGKTACSDSCQEAGSYSQNLPYCAGCPLRNPRELKFTFKTPDVSLSYLSGTAPQHPSTVSRKDLAAFLLDNGANINAKNRYGVTPLHWAATNDDPELLRFLLDRGADVDATTSYGNTPLHWAVRWSWSEPSISILISAGANLDILSRDGRTPLVRCLICNDIRSDYEIQKCLIFAENGANMDIVDNGGRGPLALALHHVVLDIEGGRVKRGRLFIRELLRNSIDFDSVVVGLLPAGPVPGHLIAKGFDSDPVAYASRLGRYDIALELVEAGGNPGKAVTSEVGFIIDFNGNYVSMNRGKLRRISADGGWARFWTRLMLCSLGGFIDPKIDDPVVAATATELIRAGLQRRNVSVDELKSELAVEIVIEGLKQAGYDRVAAGAELLQFLACVNGT